MTTFTLQLNTGPTQQELQAMGREVGLDLLRVAPALPFEDTERIYLERLERGLLGEMRWITPERIAYGCRPEELLPGARCIVIGASSYLTALDPPERNGPMGRVGRYALNDDYHDVVKRKLERCTGRWRRAWASRYGGGSAWTAGRWWTERSPRAGSGGTARTRIY
ncbi:MAG: QueG-associated DUF1730 domain-containing protein [Chloroflexia bacterium]